MMIGWMVYYSIILFLWVYDYVGNSPRWYDKEIRIIKNNKSIYSYRDAQGFRKSENRKLNVKPVDAYVYHYGWVKEPVNMTKKLSNVYDFYNEKKWLEGIDPAKAFDYSSIDSLKLFSLFYPSVMKEHINRKNWVFDYDIAFNKLSVRYKTKIFLRKYMGINSFYRNYRIV